MTKRQVWRYSLFMGLLMMCVGARADSNVVTRGIDAPASEAVQLAQPRFATSAVKPWGISGANGEMSGLLVQFADELASESGMDYSNIMQPYPRVIHSLKSGYVDFAVLFDSPSARSIAVRVGEVVKTEIIVVAAEGARPIDTVDDLVGMQVGYIRGSKYGPDFDDADHFDRVPLNSAEQGLAMVLKGRIDAMASSDQSLYWAMDSMEIDHANLSRILLLGETTGALYMSLESKRQDLLPVYRQALKRMRDKGTMDRFFYHHDAWAAAQHRSQ